jgi:hypothetical protein
MRQLAQDTFRPRLSEIVFVYLTVGRMALQRPGMF